MAEAEEEVAVHRDRRVWRGWENGPVLLFPAARIWPPLVADWRGYYRIDERAVLTPRLIQIRLPSA